MPKFPPTVDHTGKRVTLDGKFYRITQYDPNDDWCYIIPEGGPGGPMRVSAGWARQRVERFVADQSLIGKWFPLSGKDGKDVYWQCVDRYKGFFVLEDPKDRKRVGFHVDFLSKSLGGGWKYVDEPPVGVAG